MNANAEFVFFVFSGVFFLLSGIWALRTERRLKKFFSGRKARDLEEGIESIEERVSELEAAGGKISRELDEINQKLRRSVRGLATMRFNPFPEQGGNQSFALGMMNEDGDGVVLSSLYSRERMSVFAKPIRAGKSEYKLTEEEEKVLERASVQILKNENSGSK